MFIGKKEIRIKMIIWVCLLLIVAFSGVLYFYISTKVDTYYAIKYGDVFGSYDISRVDRYLDNNTLVTHQNETKPYGELRDNVVLAFEKREYTLGSTYGHGNDKFVNGIQEVYINVYESSSRQSDYVKMELERFLLFFYRVKSLESDNEFFGYLFFGTSR